MALLADRSTIVTGASSGIGRSIALQFAAEGAFVLVADIAEAPLEGGELTVTAILRQGGRAFFRRVDVSADNDVAELIADVVRRHGRLDVMVNNAATYVGKSLTDTSRQQWDDVIGVNLTGMFLGCKRAVQQMLNQEPRHEVRGRIVNISSQHGLIAAPSDVAYGVSKAGAAQLTRQVAVEHARDLIVCNAVAPGKIITGKDVDFDPGRLDYARARTPWPRLGRPQDVASAALFLASDMASYITGINLLVDGGWMAS